VLPSISAPRVYLSLMPANARSAVGPQAHALREFPFRLQAIDLGWAQEYNLAQLLLRVEAFV